MIRVQNLEHTYKSGPRIVFPDFECQAKEQVLILGRSGVGKSTLLHLVGGLMKVQAGIIEINGTDVHLLSGRKADQFRGDNIGIIFQKNHFISSLTVLENLLISQYFGQKKEDKQYCLNILDRLNIADKKGKLINTLSEGEKQRVAIARALANNPSVILADEPTSALDDENCFEVMQLLEEQAENSNAALVIVTHDNRLKDKIKNHVLLTQKIEAS